MASDGLLFRFFSHVHPKFKTPINATLFSGFLFGKVKKVKNSNKTTSIPYFSALIGAIFNLDVLVDFMSIGTLLAYTMVSACVIILRYKQVGDQY